MKDGAFDINGTPNGYTGWCCIRAFPRAGTNRNRASSYWSYKFYKRTSKKWLSVATDYIHHHR